MCDNVPRINPFLSLLNKINDELTEDQLKSLVHLSSVPASKARQITDGLDLFRYLMTQDFISHEKIQNLRKLIKEMRPAQKGLVKRIDDYIKNELPSDFEFSASGDASSWSPRVTSPQPRDDSVLCSMNCGCVKCVCSHLPSCYTPIIVLLVLAIIATPVIWYADVPKITPYINSNQDLKSAGKFIVLLEVLLLLSTIGIQHRAKILRCVTCTGYSNLESARGSSMPKLSSQSILEATAAMKTEPRTYRMSGSESAIYSLPSSYGTMPTESGGSSIQNT